MSDPTVADGLAYVKRFVDLAVYRRARELQRLVFEASKSFPKEETYALTDQMRRAARSIGAQIAEAWAKRAYRRHFLSKLTDADGEQLETQHWIITAVDSGYVTREKGESLFAVCTEIGRMLAGMMQEADSFCRKAADG